MADNGVYLIQTRECRKCDPEVFKLGHTIRMTNRFGSYPKGARCVFFRHWVHHKQAEDDIIKIFDRKYGGHVSKYGREYYRGDLNDMLRTLEDYFVAHRTVVSVPSVCASAPQPSVDPFAAVLPSISASAPQPSVDPFAAVLPSISASSSQALSATVVQSQCSTSSVSTQPPVCQPVQTFDIPISQSSFSTPVNRLSDPTKSRFGFDFSRLEQPSPLTRQLDPNSPEARFLAGGARARPIVDKSDVIEFIYPSSGNGAKLDTSDVELVTVARLLEMYSNLGIRSEASHLNAEEAARFTLLYKTLKRYIEQWFVVTDSCSDCVSLTDFESMTGMTREQYHDIIRDCHPDVVEWYERKRNMNMSMYERYMCCSHFLIEDRYLLYNRQFVSVVVGLKYLNNGVSNTTIPRKMMTPEAQPILTNAINQPWTDDVMRLFHDSGYKITGNPNDYVYDNWIYHDIIKKLHLESSAMDVVQYISVVATIALPYDYPYCPDYYTPYDSTVTIGIKGPFKPIAPITVTKEMLENINTTHIGKRYPGWCIEFKDFTLIRVNGTVPKPVVTQQAVERVQTIADFMSVHYAHGSESESAYSIKHRIEKHQGIVYPYVSSHEATMAAILLGVENIKVEVYGKSDFVLNFFMTLVSEPLSTKYHVLSHIRTLNNITNKKKCGDKTYTRPYFVWHTSQPSTPR